LSPTAQKLKKLLMEKKSFLRRIAGVRARALPAAALPAVGGYLRQRRRAGARAEHFRKNMAGHRS